MSLIDFNHNSIFCPSLPGKPDPHVSLIPGQQRARKDQESQKGNTCIYYALQIVRNNTKSPKNQKSSEEKLLSNHRKQITIWTKKWGEIEYLSQIFYEQFPDCTQNKARLYMQAINKAPNPHQELIATLQAFCSQAIYSELSDYIHAAKAEEIATIHTQLLEALKISAEEIEEYCQTTFRIPSEALRNPYSFALQVPEDQRHQLIKSTIAVREGVLTGLYVRKAAGIYKFHTSSWTPEQPITELIRQLQLHGQHLFFATLGTSFYAASPLRLKDSIEGRPVFGWSPNAPRLEQHAAHTIVVVGAELIGERGYVYFVDPNDATKAGQLETQKIYKVSYERFLSCVHDLRQRHDAPRRQRMQQGDTHIAPFVNEYALYCPQET